MKYNIILFRGMSMYTAYSGTSHRAASNAVDMARAILILTGGTANISVSYDGTRNVTLWDVVNGSASASDHALAKEVANV